jgi:hydrogenase maturation protease
MTFVDRAKRVLIIGYGNPGRCDDGLGPALAARLKELDIPGVDVESTYQLNVEDAATAAEYDVVVFVDACLCAPPPFVMRAVTPRSGTMEFSTHSQAPEGVLGLTHDVFKARTRGFAMGVRGYDFHDFGECLSEEAEENLEEAVSFLREAVLPGGELGLPLMRTVESTT